MAKNKETPAFPRPAYHGPIEGYDHEGQGGMTRRQWLAGKAMAAILSNIDPLQLTVSIMMEISENAKKMADIMIVFEHGERK